MLIRIKGGYVVDPGNVNGLFDIVIRDGKIESVFNPETETFDEPIDTEIDATGLTVAPGLIDMHVHLREPGFEYKETIETGCKAAAYGGFTAVCSMPNTNPVNDNSQVTDYIIKKADEAGWCKVYPSAAISMGSTGESLSEFGELKKSGAVAVTDDGRPVENGQLMRRALEYAKGFDIPVISHCEDMTLAAGGSMNEGEVSTRLGLGGIPNVSESLAVIRDIALCELTGSRIHIAHVSTRESVEAIRQAKQRGVKVTAETAPHYFTLTDEAVGEYDTHAKMNPPLRTDEDREAIRKGLADGTLDVIATDHAPHSPLEKEVEFNRADNGIVGLETSLGLSLKLVEDGVLDMESLIRKMSLNPASILGVNSGLNKGSDADITIIDPEKHYTVRAETFCSKGRNTPFEGWTLKGKAVMTLVNGKITFNDLTP